MDLHYVGQQWDVRVAVEAPPDKQTLRAAFERQYARLYGHYQPDGIIELTKLRVVGFGLLPALGELPPAGEPTPPEEPAPLGAGAAVCSALRGLSGSRAQSKSARQPEPYERRRVYLGRSGGWSMTDIYRGEDLRPGHVCAGPLVVEEATTTLFIGPHDVLQVDASGNFAIDLADGEAVS
jgi:N-methylhydantoinase A